MILTMFLSALLSLSLVLISSVSMMTVVESFVLPATTTTKTTQTTTTTTPTNSIFLQVDTTTTHTRSNTRHPRGKNLSPFYAASTTTIDSGNQNADVDADANSLLLQQIEDAKQILYRAADTKQEDADVVVDALVTLEKLSRKANKADPTRSEETLAALAGVSSSVSASSAASSSSSQSNSNNSGVSWRLIFTTGTIDTQRKLGGTQINYFPFKATQSFDNTQSPWLIQNGIYAPFADDFALLKFEGDFDWTVTAPTGVTKVTFDFNRIQLLNGWLDIPLKKGEAASLGAKSGLGSDNNVKLTKKGKRPFFNWISADERIATARGGGGGIALWKRI